MSFSSSGAMILAFPRSGVLSDANGEDQVLARVRHLVVAEDEQRTRGDTTNAAAQIRALASYGLRPLTGKASFAILDEQIAAGFPVPCAYLHRGPVPFPFPQMR
ncbi:MAG: hypothetical protein VKM34_05270 [Cyanobacteriota bacterium]|nr:hypothetical protein [Cyanobacteriota bacterium]